MVKVYSSDSCVYCRKLKDYLTAKGVDFEVFDVNESENAEEVFHLSGQMGIPVSVIGDKVIVGFDRTAVDSALAEQ